MSVYQLIVNQTAVQTVAAIQSIDGFTAGGVNISVQPAGTEASPNPPSYQAFQVTVSTPQPGVSVSASVQPVGSNDGRNWIPIGTAIACTSLPNISSNGSSTNVSWTYYAAYVTAISGTGAVVNCSMSA